MRQFKSLGNEQQKADSNYKFILENSLVILVQHWHTKHAVGVTFKEQQLNKLITN
jgi:hypothetical protein